MPFFKFKYFWVSIFFFSLLSTQLLGQEYEGYQYKTGDLLFQDLDCGALCNAIEKVTHGIDGKDFSHVGMVYIKNDSAFVIEAYGKNVHLTPIFNFFFRSRDESGKIKVVAMRLKPEYRTIVKPAISFALKQLGKPYDDEFKMNNGKYYCSELIYDSFKYANGGKPLFELHPMTYLDPATKKTLPVWKSYFQQLGIPIPQGKPGCNPGGLSTDTHLQLVKSFY